MSNARARATRAQGKEEGELIVSLVPHLTEAPPTSAAEEDEQDMPESVAELKGRQLGITVCARE